MRIKITTQRFASFVRDLQESFWGDLQGRTREALQKMLEADSEQQMADYLGLQWHERPGGAWYPRVADAIAVVSAARDAGAAAAQSGGERDDSASILARDFDARRGPGGVAVDRRIGERPDGFAADAGAG